MTGNACLTSFVQYRCSMLVYLQQTRAQGHKHNHHTLQARSFESHCSYASSFFVPRWMEGFNNTTWDIACIYAGRYISRFSCPDCVHVEFNQGAKWQLVYSFTQSAAWKDSYQHHYQTVYIPDDDIVQTASIIADAFSLHQQYSLKISQPVLCSWVESISASWNIVKSATTVLRYTNFVEIMVPLFSMDVFRDVVIPTLAFAETGERFFVKCCKGPEAQNYC